MKYKLLRFSLLSMLVMLCGNMNAASTKWVKTAPADLKTGDVVAIVDQTSGRAMSNNNGTSAAPSATEVTLSDDLSEISTVDENLQWNVTVGSSEGKVTYQFSAGDNYVYCTNSNNGVRVGTNNNNVFSIYDNEGVDFLFNEATSRYVGVYNSQDWRCYTSINANIKNNVLAFYKKTEDASDTRTATTVTISDPVQEGTVGESLAYPTVTVIEEESGAAIEGATVVWESSNTAVATIDRDRGYITLQGAGTTTISATYEGSDIYQGSVGSYKLNVYAAPYTTLKALQGAATSTETAVTIQFNNVVVTAVKGSNAWIADADGYGALIYTSEHGLEAGNVLNGTIDANLVLYRGQTEIKGFSKEELEITSTELTPTVKTIDAITAANQSTLVTLKGVTYDGENFTDGTNTIKFYDQFGTDVTPEADKTYDITGIVILFNTTLEIAPRTADDVAEAAEETPDPLYILGVEDVDGDNNTWTLPGDMVELTWNAKTQAYEYSIENTSTVWFCFSTNNEVSDWDTFGANYRYGIGEGNVDVTLNEAVALQQLPTATLVLAPGSYKISVTADLQMTVTGEATPVETLENGYYVVGNMTDWAVNKDYLMTLSEGTPVEEYTYTMNLTTESQFKVVKYEDGAETWYPDGMGNNYGENGEITADGKYTITFRPTGDAGDDWFYGYIKVEEEAAPATADPYEYTFESAVFKTDLVQELNGVEWTVETETESPNLSNYDGTKGQQFGTAKASLSAFTLSTSGIEGTINKVVINTSGASSIKATVQVTVGDEIFTCAGETTVSLTNAATEYVFEGSSAGNIAISYTNESAKAIYIKSIKVNPAPETYEITLAKDMVSFSCGKELDFSEVEGLSAYIVVGGTNTTAKLKEVAQVPAGEGVILQGTAGETYQVPVINIAQEIEFNFLYGTWTSDNTNTSVDAKSAYVLSDGSFKLYNGTSIESGKAYLSKDEVGSKTWLAGGEDPTAAARTLDIEGDATGIDSVTREALSNGKVYNLQGQEVKNAQKGFFIVNGKKVLVP